MYGKRELVSHRIAPKLTTRILLYLTIWLNEYSLLFIENYIYSSFHRPTLPLNNNKMKSRSLWFCYIKVQVTLQNTEIFAIFCTQAHEFPQICGETKIMFCFGVTEIYKTRKKWYIFKFHLTLEHLNFIYVGLHL